MKPPVFDYLAPDSLDEALAALEQHGVEVRAEVRAVRIDGADGVTIAAGWFLTDLEREIDSFLFEQRVSKEIASNAASIVIARRNRLDARSQQTLRQGRPERSPLKEGGRFQ